MIPQIEPWIDEAEMKEIAEVIKSTWITENKKTEDFENRIKKLTGAKYALSFCNGTVALYVAQKALGIGIGDEVIVPDFTFIATSNSVIMAGAKPVMVDVDKKTFNMDAEKLEAAITPKTKAIMPVHIYAQAADIEAIMKVAKKHSLPVIEDAAQGIGVHFKNKHVGTFGDIGMLSFYGNKTITTGEGGMLITNDEKLYKKCWQLKNHGREVKGTFIHPHIGFNFGFTEMQAAIGIAQMKKFEKISLRKKEINERYRELLKGMNDLEFTYIDTRGTPGHWFTSILVEDVEGLAKHLEKNGIQTRRFFYPLHMQPCYKGSVKGEFPNAEWAYNHGLSLPSSYNLKDEQIEFIAETIREFYK